MEQMKKLSLTGWSPSAHVTEEEAEPGLEARVGCYRDLVLPCLVAHLVRGERRGRDRKEIWLKTNQLGAQGIRSWVLQMRKLRWLEGWKSSGSGYPALKTCPVPFQAMRILRLITLALVTGHVGAETRIIKGHPCSPHSQPWQVALFQKTRLLCGATLIAPSWLLTAAHCYKPDYVALLGEYDLHREDGYEQRQKATKSFRHPGFNDSLPNKDHRNDIMLIKLPKAATITRAVRPLALPSQCVSPGTNCLISGWGTISSPQLRLPKILRCANISIIKHEECERAYPSNITDTMVCASVQEGKDSCQGDSGGPLVCNGSLQGIISWGQDPCAVSRKPGVYTKVCKYVDWIQKTIRNN